MNVHLIDNALTLVVPCGNDEGMSKAENTIQSSLKKQAKQNSDVAEQVDAANHSATPVAVPDKK